MGAIKREGSRSPLEYLESLIAPDGSVRYSRTSAQTPVWVTAQALTALAGRPFPIAPEIHAVAHHTSVRTIRGGSSAGVAAPASHGGGPLSHTHGSAPKVVRGSNQGVAQAHSFSQRRLEALARTAGMFVGVVLAPVLR